MKRFLMVAIPILAIAFAGVAVIAWPWYQWNYLTKPNLIQDLHATSGPVVESSPDLPDIDLPHSVSLDGVQISSPYALTIDGRWAIGDEIQVTVTEMMPGASADARYATLVNPFIIDQSVIDNAQTTAQREQVAETVEMRQMLFGPHSINGGPPTTTRFVRVVLIDYGNYQVFYQVFATSRIMGALYSEELGIYKDFVIKFEDGLQDTAEAVAATMTFQETAR